LDISKKRPFPTHPKVSVIMPVHNGAAFLREAIESILVQTFENFEFVIVDDGSTDETPSMLVEYELRDTRIRIHSQAQGGPAAALNRALGLARARYVARMDADDISLPPRLAAQVAFMDAHPEIGVCGTWIRMLGAANHLLRYAVDDAILRCELLFDCPIAHPSVMLRRRTFIDAGLLYEDTCFVEDYELWVRAARICGLANIPRVLLHYRQHTSQISHRRVAEQRAAAMRVRLQLLSLLELAPTNDEIALHEVISNWHFRSEFYPSLELLDRAEAWFTRLQTANGAKKVFPEPGFSSTLCLQWYRLCSASIALGWPMWIRAQRADFGHHDPQRLSNMIKLAIKCGLGRSGLRATA
jgi:glycosyltransferase involved in cell wall biosynthesis